MCFLKNLVYWFKIKSLSDTLIISCFSEHIVHIAMDSTAVVAALGSVRIGSTANRSTRTGGTGKASAVSANPIVGTTETPVNPAADIPVTIPRIKTSINL